MQRSAENSSVFRRALKVVMVAELFVTGDRVFQTAGAMMLNAEYSYWKDVTSSSMVFKIFGPATGKARLPTVDHLTRGTRR